MEVQLDRCREQGHSFEYMNYIPDFDHQCFVLEFQCEYCRLEVFDYIKDKEAADNAECGNYRSKEHSDTQSRYWKRLDETCIESYQLALKTPCVKGGGN